MIDRQITSNKNYKKIFRNPFLYRKSERLEGEWAVDLRKGRGTVLGTQSRKIEFGFILLLNKIYNGFQLDCTKQILLVSDHK